MDRQMLTRIEHWFRRGEFGRILYTCDELLQDSRYASLQPELLFWKGCAHEHAGRAWHGEAMSCFREGITSAGRDRAAKARLIAALGKLYSGSGDCASFEKLMQEFERISRDRHPQVMYWGVWVWFNYGVTLDNAFRWAEAAGAYATAAELAQSAGLISVLGECLHNLGGVQLALGKLPEAAASMAQAEQWLEDETTGHKKLSRKAEYFLAAGDLVSAQQMITAALVHPLIDDMTKADVYFTWAQTLRALNRTDESREKALLGLDFAVRAVHYPGVHKLNHFLQQLSDRLCVS